MWIEVYWMNKNRMCRIWQEDTFAITVTSNNLNIAVFNQNLFTNKIELHKTSASCLMQITRLQKNNDF